MNLYLTTGDAVDSRQVRWTGTQVDAKGAERELRGLELANVHTDPVDVPTDKQGLMEFLNKHQVCGVVLQQVATSAAESAPGSFVVPERDFGAGTLELQVVTEADVATDDAGAQDTREREARVYWHRLRAKRGWLPETVTNLFYQFVRSRGLFGELVDFARQYR